MRKALVVVLLALAVLAGCSGLAPADTDAATDPADGGTPPATTAAGGTDATTGTPAVGTATTDATAATDGMVESRPDPPTDRLGWEAGYWHDETIAVDNGDGMNASERRAAVARAMARVEYVRGLEFETNGTVPIRVISRAEHRQRTANRSATVGEALRTFDNAKFEAAFLVGEDRDSIAVQSGNSASTTLGYYDPVNDSIVLVSDTGKPQFDGEQTLAQEVGHALQDHRFNLTALRESAVTRDDVNGQNGLVEGDGNLVDRRYVERCGEEWTCIQRPQDETRAGGRSGDVHLGVNIMRYFPYSDGPPFVEYYRERGGWDRVDAMYDDPPASAEQVIYPEKYGTDPPTNVSLPETASGGWERVRPPDRADHAELGQAVVTTAFAYTVYDDTVGQRGFGVVSPRSFLNFDENGSVDGSDPFDYDVEYSSGWDGDRMHVYRNPDAGRNETAYVWRLVWDSRSDAAEFADGYRALLRYWGGERVDGRDGVWRIPADGASPFADAFSLRVEGDTVTIVNAPTVADLADVADGAGG